MIWIFKWSWCPKWILAKIPTKRLVRLNQSYLKHALTQELHWNWSIFQIECCVSYTDISLAKLGSSNLKLFFCWFTQEVQKTGKHEFQNWKACQIKKTEKEVYRCLTSKLQTFIFLRAKKYFLIFCSIDTSGWHGNMQSCLSCTLISSFPLLDLAVFQATVDNTSMNPKYSIRM